MPGVLQSFSVVTPSGHQVDVSIGHHSWEITTLRSLECIRCHGINYNGRKIECCDHTVCQPCMDQDDSLKSGEHECHGDIVTGKTLSNYSVETRARLNNLIVICPVGECRQQARLSDIDRHINGHIAHHPAEEVHIVNSLDELPPGVLWHEHEGRIYYRSNPDAPRS